MNAEEQAKITTIEDVPIIDFNQFMGKEESDPHVKELCKSVADSLHRYGILIVKDPRVDEKDNDDYIDMMERYFDSRGKMLYSG
mmetsp:Transcript_13372/g.22761  ORF Transcript_13372/g.22761 Transcript_13372/m.22761 type:complete len:84 (-) Transcript_13372:914-1165(-)